MNEFQPKDYVYASGFYAAVVSAFIEDNRVLTTVRYYQDELGDTIKLNTEEATQLLELEKSDFLFYSKNFDVNLHGIPLTRIEKIYRPRDSYFFLRSLPVRDIKQTEAIEIFDYFNDAGLDQNILGITGSLLIGFQTDRSDIDFVIYGRENFYLARQIIKQGLESNKIEALDTAAWRDSYDRRDCAIDFKTYQFHEQRKYNKFLYNNTKVDISLVLNPDEIVEDDGPYKKLSNTVIQATVVDDSKSFDLPARYYLDDPKLSELVCYTATYIGQAKQGEIIEVSGVIEENSNGDRRLLVGTSREAKNEYIKVLR